MSTETPWMTLADACQYTRRSYETVRRAAVAFQRDPRKGLRAFQERPHACYRFHRDDLDRWVMGQPPARGAVRAA